MESQKALVEQLERLNKNLEESLMKNRYFIYSAKPWKFILYNFLAGALRALGSTIGTVLILAIGGYLASRILSQINFTEKAAKWLQQVVQQAGEKKPVVVPPSL